MMHNDIRLGSSAVLMPEPAIVARTALMSEAGPMRVNVHLGAHKTATTFIQSQLRRKRAVLLEKGVRIGSLKTLRRDFTDSFDIMSWVDPVLSKFTRPVLARKLDSVMQAQGGADTFILSDENLLGLIGANYWTGRLYPMAGMRLRLLEALLKAHETRYFLSIRRYADYLTSSWLQLAARGKAPKFEKYLAKFPPEGRGWADIVADLAAVCGPERLTVWTYDWMSSDPGRIFPLLAPGVLLDLSKSQLRRDVLPSLTLKGLQAISLLQEHLTDLEFKRMVRVMRNFRFEEPNPRLEIADPGLLAAYDAKYAEDLERIRALGVQLHV